MKPTRPYRYEETKRLLATILDEFRILAGDKVGPGGASWQDVAGTASVNLKVLALRLDAARAGMVVDGPLVFPSPDDLDEVA
jgi:hypothetical protein